MQSHSVIPKMLVKLTKFFSNKIYSYFKMLSLCSCFLFTLMVDSVYYPFLLKHFPSFLKNTYILGKNNWFNFFLLLFFFITSWAKNVSFHVLWFQRQKRIWSVFVNIQPYEYMTIYQAFDKKVLLNYTRWINWYNFSRKPKILPKYHLLTERHKIFSGSFFWNIVGEILKSFQN